MAGRRNENSLHNCQILNPTTAGHIGEQSVKSGAVAAVTFNIRAVRPHLLLAKKVVLIGLCVKVLETLGYRQLLFSAPAAFVVRLTRTGRRAAGAHEKSVRSDFGGCL